MPRILIAGTGSGAGKTSITCGILNSLIRRGHSAAAFKCGPDYIDTMFHSRVLGVSTGNLDSFFTDRDKLLYLIWKNGREKEISIVEGVMGYYDGIGFTDQGSSRDIAKLTDTPVVLLVNCQGMGCSVLAVLKGFLEFRKPSMIRGVIFNRMPESLYPEAKKQAEEMGLSVFGYVPRQKQELLFQSRHLGLVTAREIENFKEIVDRFSDQLEQTVDLDGLLTLAKSAPPIGSKAVSVRNGRIECGERIAEPLRIAVAKDEAFCFLYRDNMDYLQEHGCEIVYFSPLKDSGPGEDIDGLILSGGYPELYAEKLASNEPMRRQIRRQIENGLPCIAECGGFLYLHEELEGADGIYHPMAGVLKGRCYKTEHLQRFGYLELKPEADCLLGETGDTIRAHSFHYWDSEHKGSAFLAVKPGSGRQWQEGISSDTMYAGFPHLYFYGNEKAADRFIAKAREYHRERAQRHGEPRGSKRSIR
ncbi:cobyrinate a,c-diamide synthase [Diplocloster hominis]|uniref:cobyrinate a,c-diamide synthase n=1 Tax=Diplocloster hominis TaxID=3079010 RepID=UPI0031BA6DEA